MTVLFVVSTPIGNLEDITLRAIKTLLNVDLIACEDTRKTGQLLLYFRKRSFTFLTKEEKMSDKKPRLLSYYEHNEEERISEIINYLKSGRNVALVSSAGTPTISDPGFKLVRECVRRKIKVVPIPGASGILASLVVSGLPTDKFVFLGFLPKKNGKKITLFKQLLFFSQKMKKFPTIIFYESPSRVGTTLKLILKILTDVEIVITRELTKVHEEIWRGKVSQALTYFKKPKGEFTILLNIPQE